MSDNDAVQGRCDECGAEGPVLPVDKFEIEKDRNIVKRHYCEECLDAKQA
jgi:hypothetical protein